MSVAVLIPFRASDIRRDQLLAYTTKWLESHHDWPVVIGESPPGPFSRSAALNDAARKAGAWDLVVVHDGDTVVPGRQLSGAVQMAQVTGRVVFAFTSVVELSRDCTDAILASGDLSLDDLRIDAVRVAPLEIQSSALVIPRPVWEKVGGFDEKFRGWSAEDNAFYRAVEICCGAPYRIPGHAFHLWHEPGRPHRNDPSYQSNQRRWRSYKAADTPDRIRILLGR